MKSYLVPRLACVLGGACLCVTRGSWGQGLVCSCPGTQAAPPLSISQGSVAGTKGRITFPWKMKPEKRGPTYSGQMCPLVRSSLRTGGHGSILGPGSCSSSPHVEPRVLPSSVTGHLPFLLKQVRGSFYHQGSTTHPSHRPTLNIDRGRASLSCWGFTGGRDGPKTTNTRPTPRAGETGDFQLQGC